MPAMFLRLGHINARKKVFSPAQQVMMEKSFDKLFHHRIFKKTDPSSAGVKAAPAIIKFQTKIWVMAAT